MQQKPMAARFKLAIHRQMKELPVSGDPNDLPALGFISLGGLGYKTCLAVVLRNYNMSLPPPEFGQLQLHLAGGNV